MGARSLWHLTLLFFCLQCSSGTGKARTLGDEDNQDIFSSYELKSQLDGVPVVNPTTPGSANPSPWANPSPQSPDTTMQTPTTPYMTPISPDSPMTTPTITPANPYMSPTIPTTPPVNPTATPAITTSPPANPTTTPTGTGSASSGGQWCVASQTASETALQTALDFACGYGGADCSAIQSGASCYNPDTVRDHASYAFNAYYQKNPSPTSCSFGGIAQLTNKDPSTGNCHYTSPKSQSMSPPIYQSPPTNQNPLTNQSPLSQSSPMTTTPPSVTMPSGSTVFGPSQSPNFASSLSNSLLLMITMCSFWASLLTKNIF